MEEERKLTKKELKELRRMERAEKASADPQKGNALKWIVVGLVGVLFISLFGYVIYSAKQKRVEEASKPVEFSNAGWVKGAATAPNTLVEFADFQCPHCKQFEPFIAQLMQEYDGKLKLQYKYFPLSFKQSMIAAEAAEAAGQQDKFWEMHDMLFEEQENLASAESGVEFVTKLAQDLGLDMEQFEKDLNSNETDAAINATREEGVNAGVMGTPTFFVNGKRIELQSSTYDSFKQAVEAQFKSAPQSSEK